jgi:tetratricopeptide (TPR) repeat protein
MDAMKPQGVLLGVSGVLFGVLVGWILGSQRPAGPVTAPASVAAAAPGPGSGNTPPPLDIQRATDLERQANARPADAAVREALGNLYFDAQRFDLAIPWYEAALKIDRRNVNVSTDLAVSLFSTSEVDRALKQIDHSLSVDPRHAKTLLNQGIIRAWGKQDLDGAAKSWEQVVAVSPSSEEGKQAKQFLDGLKAAHKGAGGAPNK